MSAWIAPKGTKVVFQIDAFDGPYHPSIVVPGGMTVEQRDAALGEFRARFKLPKKVPSFDYVRVDDSRWPALLDALAESTGRRQLRMKSCWLEEPEPRDSDPHAWFHVHTGPTEFRSPRRVPESMHIGWRDGQCVASQRFRDVVDREGFIGLGWLPLEDSSPSDPMAWYEVYAEEPIGRGLDHPLIDPAKLEPKRGEPGWSKQRLDPARRWGQETAWLRAIHDDVAWEPGVIRRLIETCPAYFRVQGPHRFVREHLPARDFAYMGWGFNADTGAGFKGRPIRSICCNARVRAALIEAGVVKASRFEPMVSVPAEDARAEILDRTIALPLPLPMYTPDEAAKERSRREAILRGRAPEVQRAPLAGLAEALAFLERRLADDSASWTPARDFPAFEEIRSAKLFKETPEAWQRLAPLLPISVETEDFTFCMGAPEWNEWLSEEPDQDADDAPSTNDLIIARTPYGDWFAVRRGDARLPGDACIAHWDHETLGIADEWPSVAAFAAHLVATCDAAGRASPPGGGATRG